MSLIELLLWLWPGVVLGSSTSSMVPDVRGTFGIAFVRSSGSTWLCSLLNAQAGILCHDEYVGKDWKSVLRVVQTPLQLVDKALNNSGFDRDAAAAARKLAADVDQRSFVVGFKQKAELLFAGAPRLCQRWGTKWLFVHRRNVVAHAVSILRKADQIAQLQQPGRVVRFFTNHNGQSRTQRTARWRQPGSHAATNRGRVHVAPLHVLWDQFVVALDELRAATHLLEYFENATLPACSLRIDMEELLADQLGTLRRVVEHINGSSAGLVAGDVDSQQRIVKTSPDDWRLGVANWQEFRDQLWNEMPEMRRFVE